MSFLQLIQREIMNMLKLLGLGPSSWFHDDDEQEEEMEEEETMQEEEAEEAPEEAEPVQNQESPPKNEQSAAEKPQADQSELLKRLQERFAAKQNAREERQMKLLREKELADRQLNPLKADDAPANAEQLEFNFEAESRPEE